MLRTKSVLILSWRKLLNLGSKKWRVNLAGLFPFSGEMFFFVEPQSSPIRQHIGIEGFFDSAGNPQKLYTNYNNAGARLRKHGAGTPFKPDSETSLASPGQDPTPNRPKPWIRPARANPHGAQAPSLAGRGVRICEGPQDRRPPFSHTASLHRGDLGHFRLVHLTGLFMSVYRGTS